jgi:hypothetical protein
MWRAFWAWLFAGVGERSGGLLPRRERQSGVCVGRRWTGCGFATNRSCLTPTGPRVSQLRADHLPLTAKKPGNDSRGERTVEALPEVNGTRWRSRSRSRSKPEAKPESVVLPGGLFISRSDGAPVTSVGQGVVWRGNQGKKSRPSETAPEREHRPPSLSGCSWCGATSAM